MLSVMPLDSISTYIQQSLLCSVAEVFLHLRQCLWMWSDLHVVDSYNYILFKSPNKGEN